MEAENSNILLICKIIQFYVKTLIYPVFLRNKAKTKQRQSKGKAKTKQRQSKDKAKAKQRQSKGKAKTKQRQSKDKTKNKTKKKFIK